MRMGGTRRCDPSDVYIFRVKLKIHKMKGAKKLRIGLIGIGFMGRTHTNGYKRVGDFFPALTFRPVLKAVCSRNAEKVKAFAEQWGYESTETDWKKLIARD